MATTYRAWVQTRSTAKDYRWLQKPGTADPDEWWTQEVQPGVLLGSPLGVATPAPGGIRAYLSHVPSERTDRIGSGIRYNLALAPANLDDETAGHQIVTEHAMKAILGAWADAVVLSASSPSVLGLGRALDEALVHLAEDQAVSVDAGIEGGLIDPTLLLSTAVAVLSGNAPGPSVWPRPPSWIGIDKLSNTELVAAMTSPSGFAWSALVGHEMVDDEPVRPLVPWLVPGEGVGRPKDRDPLPPDTGSMRADDVEKTKSKSKSGCLAGALATLMVCLGLLLVL